MSLLSREFLPLFFLVVLDKTNVLGVLAEALTADHDVVFADDRVLVRAHAAV